MIFLFSHLHDGGGGNLGCFYRRLDVFGSSSGIILYLVWLHRLNNTCSPWVGLKPCKKFFLTQALASPSKDPCGAGNEAGLWHNVSYTIPSVWSLKEDGP